MMPCRVRTSCKVRRKLANLNHNYLEKLIRQTDR